MEYLTLRPPYKGQWDVVACFAEPLQTARLGKPHEAGKLLDELGLGNRATLWKAVDIWDAYEATQFIVLPGTENQIRLMNLGFCVLHLERRCQRAQFKAIPVNAPTLESQVLLMSGLAIAQNWRSVLAICPPSLAAELDEACQLYMVDAGITVTIDIA